MADDINKRRNKKNNIASDRVIYLNRKDIRNSNKRRQMQAQQANKQNREDNTSRSANSSSPNRGKRPRNGQTVQPINQRQSYNRSNTVGMQKKQVRQNDAQKRRRPAQEPQRAKAQAAPNRQRSTKPVRQGSAPQRPIRQTPNRQKRPRIKWTGNEKYFILSRRLPPIYFSCNSDAKGEGRRYRKTSRRGNNRGMIIVAAFIAVLFMIYIGGYAINMLNKDSIAYETIQIGSVDSAKKADGIIIRSEKVFTAPASGAVEYAVGENEKIRSGTVVCSISNAQTVSQIQEDLNNINNDILKQQQNRQDLSEHTDEVNKLETQIKNLTDENAFDFVNGNFSDVYNLKYSVENKLNTRNQLLLNENSASLAELVGQRNNELKQISDNTKQVTSDVGGIISYAVDGTESELTFEALATLTKEQTLQKPTAASGIKTNVAANDPIFKVITSNEWYIAAYMPSSYTEGWEVGKEMSLYLQNGVEANRSLNVTVDLLEDHEKDSYVVFKTADYMADYMDFRNISFEIDKPKTGYKIPNTAISQQTLLKIPAAFVDQDSNTVVKVTDSGTKTLEITISGTENDENGNYVLVPVQIGYLSPGDTLKNGEDTIKAEDVVTVDGVFLVNSGVTKFVKINKENSVTSSDYTVLDESNNTTINIYDRVVQNVANVQENQNIYE